MTCFISDCCIYTTILVNNITCRILDYQFNIDISRYITRILQRNFIQLTTVFILDIKFINCHITMNISRNNYRHANRLTGLYLDAARCYRLSIFTLHDNAGIMLTNIHLTRNLNRKVHQLTFLCLKRYLLFRDANPFTSVNLILHFLFAGHITSRRYRAINCINLNRCFFI